MGGCARKMGSLSNQLFYRGWIRPIHGLSHPADVDDIVLRRRLSEIGVKFRADLEHRAPSLEFAAGTRASRRRSLDLTDDLFDPPGTAFPEWLRIWRAIIGSQLVAEIINDLARRASTTLD